MSEETAEYVLNCAKQADYADVRAETFKNTVIQVVNGIVQKGLQVLPFATLVIIGILIILYKKTEIEKKCFFIRN